MGYLYKRGNVWWAKYYVNGAPRRESTGTEKQEEARRFLRDKEGRVAAGQPMLPRVDRIRYEEAAADLRSHYRTTGDRNLEEAGYRLAHLERFFAGRRISAIGSADVTKYVEQRQAEEAENGTVNKEIGVLKRMLRLAYEQGKLLRMPVIHTLKENGPRQGFFEREQYEVVRSHLRQDLQVAVAVAYTFGWRMQSEVLTLERRQLDLEAGTLRLEPGTTKNDDGRLVYLPAGLEIALREQVARVQALARQTGRIVPWLFPYLKGHRQGQRILDFRKAWATACKKAGVSGRLRHDFRRTAVRNMVNAGIPERVAMKVTGHRTRAVFDRYHIVSPGDLREVARRMEHNHGHNQQVRLDSARASVQNS
jgi:integrase